ncbi:MAG: PucR family transcriptional regulator [Sciscionella sp.]
MPELRLTAHAPATALQHEVSRVYSTELPDPSRYLRGGELVLSGLLWRHGPADTETFVRALSEHRIAALAASGADSGDVLPPDLIEACARHAVALVEVPPDLSFAVITERVAELLTAERGADTLSARHSLLAAAAGGAGLAALVRAAGDALGVPCWVRSATGRVVAGTPVATTASWELGEKTSATLLPWFVVVGANRDRLSAAEQATAEEVATLVAMQRSRSRLALDAARRASAPLLRLLADGHTTPAELAVHLTGAGIEADSPCRVLTATTIGLRPSTAPAVLEEVLSELGAHAPCEAVRDIAYALVPQAQDWPRDFLDRADRAVQAVAAQLGSGRVVVAISRPSTAAGFLGAAAESRHALRLGLSDQRRCVVMVGEQITVHELLLAGAPDELRRSMYQRMISPVADYDDAHHTELLATLTAFLECSGSWQLAAQQLHVHVNTLRYRMGRVEQLLGTDLGDFASRVDLYLALRAGAL